MLKRGAAYDGLSLGRSYAMRQGFLFQIAVDPSGDDANLRASNPSGHEFETVFEEECHNIAGSITATLK